MNIRMKMAAVKHRREKAKQDSKQDSSERMCTQWEIEQSLIIQLDKFKAKCVELETENKELYKAAIAYFDRLRSII